MRAVQTSRPHVAWTIASPLALVGLACGPAEPAPPELICPVGRELAAEQLVCIESCGDGVVDIHAGEVCDDGNVRAGDDCPSDCSRCGETWQRMPAQPSWHLASISGTGPAELFAVGAIGPALTLSDAEASTWTPHTGLSEPDYRGALFRYDGEYWSIAAKGMPPLYSVWADRTTGVAFAVGAGGVIGRYDGGTWSTMDAPAGDTLTGVWGRRADDVFAVGLGGALLHYDGQRWTFMEHPGGAADLFTVFGLGSAEPDAAGGAEDVFVGGAAGTLLRYRRASSAEAAAWEQMTVPPDERGDEITELWGQHDAEDDDRLHVFASAARRKALYYDGNDEGVWTLDPDDEAPLPFMPNAQGLWGTSPDDLFAVSLRGVIAWRNNTFTDGHLELTEHALLDVWGSSGEDIFAVGINGTIVHNARRALEPLGPPLLLPSKRYLQGIWVRAPDRIYAVGSNGRILRYDGSEWHEMASSTTETLLAIWGSERGDLYAVGDAGTILHYDDAEPNGEQPWTPVAWTPLLPGQPPPTLRGVWGRDGEVYAVGGVKKEFGTIVRRDENGQWSEMASAAADALYAIWVSEGGRAFAVGRRGIIVTRDADGPWRPMAPLAQPTLLRGVWGAGGEDVFAVGLDGRILHYDGNLAGEWSDMDSCATKSALVAVWGTGPDHVFAISGGLKDDEFRRSEIVHYNGERWTRLPYVHPYRMRAVHGLSSGQIVFTGRRGRTRSLSLPVW